MPFRVYLCLGLVFLGLLSFNMPGQASKILNDTFITNPFSHHIWNEVVSEHVDVDGAVDFNGLRAFPKRLNHYIRQLEKASPLSQPDLFPDRNSRLAYWINAHNALAMRLILDRYPIKRLSEVPEFRTSTHYKLGGIPFSLNQVESILRQQFFPWPEAFLAISDLSINDPRLLNQAYQPKRLQEQLKTQAYWIMQNPRFVEVPADCSDILLGASFKQFEPSILRYLQERKNDEAPSLETFIKQYQAPDIQGVLASECPEGSRKIVFKPFNDSLNRLP